MCCRDQTEDRRHDPLLQSTLAADRSGGKSCDQMFHDIEKNVLLANEAAMLFCGSTSKLSTWSCSKFD